MHYLFLLARVFPYWALPAIIVLAQLALFFRRRKNGAQYTCAVGALLFVVGIFAWFAFRGDLHSDDWVRTFVGSGDY